MEFKELFLRGMEYRTPLHPHKAGKPIADDGMVSNDILYAAYRGLQGEGGTHPIWLT